MRLVLLLTPTRERSNEEDGGCVGSRKQRSSRGRKIGVEILTEAICRANGSAVALDGKASLRGASAVLRAWRKFNPSFATRTVALNGSSCSRMSSIAKLDLVCVSGLAIKDESVHQPRAYACAPVIQNRSSPLSPLRSDLCSSPD